jgi:hypothetical protein
MSNTLWPAPVQRIVLGCKIPHELEPSNGRPLEEEEEKKIFVLKK